MATTTKIIKFEVIPIRLPMKFTFKTGFGEIQYRDTIIVKLTTADGLVGYGECAALSEPVYLEESIVSVMAVLEHILKPVVLHQALSPELFYKQTLHYRGNKIAKFGVECALWSIQSQAEKQSLSSLLGGTRTKIAVGESIGILPTVDETLSLISKRVTEGYQRIKIKIKPGWDVQLVRAIRAAFPDLPLMVDANSSYRLEDVELFKKLDRYNLMMIEQPLDFDDLWYHSLLQKQIATPICLDESITSYSQAKKAIELKACRIINVKPGRIGSLIETIQINDLAKEHSIPLWCGGMLESGVGKAFNILAASLSEFSLPADLSASDQFFYQDIVTPAVVISSNGTIKAPQTPGMGYEVNEAALESLRV